MTRKSKSGSTANPPAGQDASRGGRITRRGFLGVAGAALSAATLPSSLTACNPINGSPAPDFTATLLRPDDLLSLTLNFFNLKLSADSKTLVPIHPGNTAYVSVDFGREHVLEKSFEEGVPISYPPAPPPPPIGDNPATTPPASSPIPSLISGRSRVVFLVPAGQSIDYTVEGLLGAFGKLQMNVPSIATPNDGATLEAPLRTTALALQPRQQRLLALRQLAALPSSNAAIGGGPPSAAPSPFPSPPIAVRLRPPLPAEPGELETALELPTRLIISPNAYGGWAHATGEVTSKISNRTEVWHTRLGVQVAGGIDESDRSAALRTVRAVWTRDPGFEAAQNAWAAGSTNPSVNPNPTLSVPAPFNASLLPQHRADIVYESANFGTFRRPRSPKAVKANRVILSALGGWLDVRGDFGQSTDSGLELWEHRATMGRDHYVKVVYSGILFPWGHRASLLRITERRLTNGAEALWTHYYIIVRQPTIVYDPGTDSTLQKLLRQHPFTQLTITTLSTPELNPPPVLGGGDVGPTPALLVGTTDPYLFKMVGRDHEGTDIHFEAPAVWAPTKAGNVQAGITVSGPSGLKSLFDGLGYSAPAKGQRIAFAPQSPDPNIPPGKTTFETHTLTHSGAEGTGFPKITGGSVPFVPQLTGADIVVEALRGFGNVDGTIAAKFHDAYLNDAFDAVANKGELLLDLVKTSVEFSKSSDKTGGFLSPNLAVNALSRIAGPVGGTAATLAAGTFDPADFFSGILNEAKVFGVFTLDKIIPIGNLLDHAPKFVTEALNEIDTLLADANTILNLAKQVKDGAASLGSAPTLKTILEDIPTQAGNIVAAIGAGNAADAKTAIDALKTDLDQLPGELASAGASVGLPAALATQIKTFAAPLSQALGTLSGTIGALLTAYQDLQNLATTQTFKLDWTTPLKPFGLVGPPPAEQLFDPKGNKTLFLKAEMRLKATGGKPAGVDLVCGIDPFDINLLGSTTFITVHVETLQFSLKSGAKADVSVALGKPGLEFKGPLSFVQTLTSIIPLDGFLDPPGLEVNASGITASFSIPIPSLAIGVFALANISIGASLHVPFIGATPLTVGFNFCTRDEPFVLTVMFIGGGGFFGVTFDPNGIQILEASFEAGACLAVDFGVASGSISAMVGVYFKMEADAATLTGFFRLRGEVDVLGIITASIELYLELTYESASGKVTGTATLDIDVKVLFFHVSVSITCTKRFAGANGDPSFLQMMSPWDPVVDGMKHTNDPADFALLPPGYDPWAEYLLAFAA